MNQKNFFETIKKEIMNFLPSEYEEPKLNVIAKTNTIKNAMIICKKGSNIAPMIYLDDYFESFKNGREISSILKEIAEIIMQSQQENVDVSFLLNLGNVKDKITPKVINFMWNKEYLSDKPYRFIAEDLVVTYYIKINVSNNIGNNIGNIVVNERMLQSWNISKEELHKIALENLQEQSPAVSSMEEQLKELVFSDLIKSTNGDKEAAEIMFQEMFQIDFQEEKGMYVLTNKEKFLGANMILHSEAMKEIREKMGGDFYLIPSSIHEWILVPMETTSMEELNFMVKDINMSQVHKEEWLSDHVYILTEKGIKIAA